MTYPRMLMLNWLALLIGLAVFSCQALPARAESGVYLDLAGGGSFYSITAADGDYIQKGLPHSLDTRSLAYRVGLGYSFNDRWALRASYINLGSVKQSAKFVADQDYNAKLGQCVSNCANAAPYRMTDNYKGLELVVSRSFRLSEAWTVQASAGGAYLDHRFTINKNAGTNDESHRNRGQFVAPVVGAGVGYRWIFTELSYYHGLGGSNGFMGQDQAWPLSKEIVVAWFGIKVPFAAW